MAEEKTVVCPQCGKKYKLAAEFNAASFSCKACSATVWVSGKAPAPELRRKGGGKTRAGRGGRAAGRTKGRAAASAAAAPPARRGGRGSRDKDAADEEHEEGGRRGRYEKPKSNANVFIAIAGLLLIVGVVLFIVLNDNKKPAESHAGQPPQPGPSNPGGAPPADDLNPSPTPPAEAGGPPAKADPGGAPEKPPAPAGTGQGTDGAAEETKPAKAIGGKPKGTEGFTTRYDPPPDLGHLPDTPEDMKKKIDEWITQLMDPMAGADSHRAKDKLIAVGKPAFLPILGAMAKIRDSITDVDSDEERTLESSLMLADRVLREMDGYLEANNRSSLRPGSEKKYIAYICRLHYKRWVTVLHEMPTMPGAFDPTKEYEKETETYSGGAGK